LHKRLVAEWWRIAGVAAAVVAVCSFSDVTRSLDNQLYDRAIGLVRPPPSDRIVLVEIDNASLNQLGRWPWPRQIHARMLDRIAAVKPTAIGYDVLFLEPNGDDLQLAEAMRRAGNVYLPSIVEREARAGGAGLEGLPAVLQAAAQGIGSAELETDGDGVVREACRIVPADDRTVRQMFGMLADTASPLTQSAAQRCFHVPYVPTDHFLHVSFASLLDGRISAEVLHGKLVIVGLNADGLGDRYAVPASAGGLMSGIELHANAAHALVTGRTIRPLPAWPAFALSLLPLSILLLGYRHIHHRFSAVLFGGAVLAALAGSAGLLAGVGTWFSPVPAIVGLAVVFMLWSWRRLSVLGAFVGQEAANLRADLATQPDPKARGDVLSGEANQLHGLIDQLRRLRAFVADIIRFQPDALCVIDERGVVNLGNEAACQLYGGEVENVPFDQVMAVIGRDAQREGRLLTRPDGRVLMVSEATLGEDRRLVRFADVTDLQRAATEREETLQFLSHDLRTPNAGIVTLLDTHALDGGRADVALLLERIRAHARHGLNLADDFVRLARSRARPLKRHPVEMCDVAREAVDMVWAKASDREIGIDQTEPAEQDLWVIGDRAMLVRATLNLLDNAVKFAPKGARISYSVEGQGCQVLLKVSGPSPEMPAARAANPFAFYADGRDTEGGASVGLGLAFVESAASRHGGEVAYHYVADYGATFTMIIPAAPVEEPTV